MTVLLYDSLLSATGLLIYTGPGVNERGAPCLGRSIFELRSSSDCEITTITW